jgi:hypothetical protein
MTPNAINMHIVAIAKWYFQDFCRQLFSSLLKTPGIQKNLGRTMVPTSGHVDTGPSSGHFGPFTIPTDQPQVSSDTFQTRDVDCHNNVCKPTSGQVRFYFQDITTGSDLHQLPQNCSANALWVRI